MLIFMILSMELESKGLESVLFGTLVSEDVPPIFFFLFLNEEAFREPSFP